MATMVGRVGQPAQATRQTRHSAVGSDSGSPWTRTKSAGPALARSRRRRARRAARRRATSPRRAPPTARARPRRATRPPRRAGSPGASRRRSRCRVAIRTPAAVRPGATLSRPLAAGRDRSSRPSAPANRSIVVVAPNDTHDRKTASVETRNVPRRAISAATSSSSSKPCSIASTPPATPFARAVDPAASGRSPARRGRGPPRRPARSPSTDHGQTRRIGAVEVELEEVGAVVELADPRRRRARRASAPRPSTAAERAGPADPGPGGPDVRPAGPAARSDPGRRG